VNAINQNLQNQRARAREVEKAVAARSLQPEGIRVPPRGGGGGPSGKTSKGGGSGKTSKGGGSGKTSKGGGGPISKTSQGGASGKTSEGGGGPSGKTSKGTSGPGGEASQKGR
jgi:hypothetical protein